LQISAKSNDPKVVVEVVVATVVVGVGLVVVGVVVAGASGPELGRAVVLDPAIGASVDPPCSAGQVAWKRLSMHAR
jgi:hypothetical protein